MPKITRRRPGTVSAGSSGGSFGKELLVPNCKARLVKADWDNNKYPTTMHIVPWIRSADEDGNPIKKQFGPFRDSPGDIGLTYWLVRLPVVSIGKGKSMVQYIESDMDGIDEWNRSEADKTLYGRISGKARAAVKQRAADANYRVYVGDKEFDPSDWAPLFPGYQFGSFKDQMLCTSGSSQLKGFFMVILLVSGDRVRFGEKGYPSGGGPDDAPNIFMASYGLTEDILSQMNEVKDGVDDEEAYLPEHFRLGDVTKLDGSGKWLVVYNKERASSFSRFFNQRQTVDVDADEEEVAGVSRKKTSRPKKKSSSWSDKGYAAKFVSKVIGPEVLEEGEDPIDAAEKAYSVGVQINRKDMHKNILTTHEEITEYLEVATVEQQAEYIYTALSSEPAAFNLWLWATQDIPEARPPKVQAMLKSRKTALSLGASQDVEQEEVAGGRYRQVDADDDQDLDDILAMEDDEAPFDDDDESQDYDDDNDDDDDDDDGSPADYDDDDEPDAPDEVDSDISELEDLLEEQPVAKPRAAKRKAKPVKGSGQVIEKAKRRAAAKRSQENAAKKKKSSTPRRRRPQDGMPEE